MHSSKVARLSTKLHSRVAPLSPENSNLLSTLGTFVCHLVLMFSLWPQVYRHKPKPGITGLAESNGFRGASDAFEEFLKNIEFDLYYLRNWSLRIDAYVTFKAVRLVLHEQKAY